MSSCTSTIFISKGKGFQCAEFLWWWDGGLLLTPFLFILVLSFVAALAAFPDSMAWGHVRGGFRIRVGFITGGGEVAQGNRELESWSKKGNTLSQITGQKEKVLQTVLFQKFEKLISLNTDGTST